jgi:hypothetical protein
MGMNGPGTTSLPAVPHKEGIMAESQQYRLEVPVDASQAADFKPNHPVKVVAYARSGETRESVVRLSTEGKATASFTFEQAPGPVQVALGPDTVSADDLKNLQTITANVPASSWASAREVIIPVVPISTYYWRWWLHWCRSFKVTGRLVCSDGSPVAGATVTAYDVDAWWWWTSQEQVGTALTDASGSFEIDFTRCCGWFPWYWWALRYWAVDPYLVDQISAVLKRNLSFGRLPAALPAPSLDVFQKLLASSAKTSRAGVLANAVRPAGNLVDTTVDPNALTDLRDQLLNVLPREFPLPIWPWYPWYPWFECGANLIFKATQVCSGQTQTIVSQTIADTNWDVSTTFNVTLTTNDQACCAYSCGDDCPEGNCIVPTEICDIIVGSIGGNLGAPASKPSQIGLYAPGTQDRPFAGNVDIIGLFGSLVNVDYYEFQYATSAAGPYQPLPQPAVGGFDRSVLVTLPGPSFSWSTVAFPATQISDGTTMRNVIETITHYQNNHGPQEWNTENYNLLVVLQSLNNLLNGTYYLQLVGYVRPGYTGDLALADTDNPGNPGILAICDPYRGDKKENNWWVVTLDNQAPGDTDPSSIPNGGNQPCGLHTCTDQPTSAILQLAILHQDGSSTVIQGCQTFSINCTDQLQIDFAAYDPDGFLDSYSLLTLYGLDESVDLLGLTASYFGPSPIAPSWAPSTSQVGPDYPTALSQVASSPVWSGGSIRLTVPATGAFPTTCAYLLQLNVYKRPIVDCDDDDAQRNLSYESFTIQSNCPSS